MERLGQKSVEALDWLILEAGKHEDGVSEWVTELSGQQNIPDTLLELSRNNAPIPGGSLEQLMELSDCGSKSIKAATPILLFCLELVSKRIVEILGSDEAELPTQGALLRLCFKSAKTSLKFHSRSRSQPTDDYIEFTRIMILATEQEGISLGNLANIERRPEGTTLLLLRELT